EVLAVGRDDGTVCLAWHLPHGELKDELPGHDSPVVELAFSRDGRTFASRDAAGKCRLWGLSGPRCLAHFSSDSLLAGGPDFEPDHAAVVSRRGCQASSRDRQWLAAGRDGGVVVWTPPSGWEKLGHTPLDEISLPQWERLRAALAKGGLPGDEAR